MLLTVPGDGFSKTARSHPRHREACRRVDPRAARAIVAWAHAHYFAERAAEGAETSEANVEADVRDASPPLAQEEHGPLHPPALQVAVGCLAEGGAKGADEMSLGHAGQARQRQDVERLRVAAVDR